MLESLVGVELFKRQDLESEFSTLRGLVDIRFHERAFSLWIKSRKSALSEQEFKAFNVRLSRTIDDVLERPDQRVKTLDYVSFLDPRPIEILDIRLVDRESRISLNMGVKRFSEGRLDDAYSAFLDSVSIDPGNPLAHWNLARLAVALGSSEDTVRDEYRRAESLMTHEKLKIRIRKESAECSKRGRIDSRLGPVSECELAFALSS